jgi:hypothetical protein
MACYGNGILQQLSNDKAAIVRNARSHVMAKVGIPVNIQTAIIANHDPDWADKDCVFKHREVKLVQLFEMHRNAAIHWFQNGHPMKSWITNSAELLFV